MGFNIYGPPGAVLPTGSRLTSSIHISPTSVSPTILNSRVNRVASDSVWMMRSTLVQRPTVFKHCSKPPRGAGARERCFFVLRDPDPALALRAGGDQVPEPQSHLGAVTNGPLGVAIILVAGHVGFQMQAVGPGDGVPGVAALLGRLGPGKLRLCQVLFAIQGHESRTDAEPKVNLTVRTARSGSYRRRGCADARAGAGGARSPRGPG